MEERIEWVRCYVTEQNLSSKLKHSHPNNQFLAKSVNNLQCHSWWAPGFCSALNTHVWIHSNRSVRAFINFFLHTWFPVTKDTLFPVFRAVYLSAKGNCWEFSFHLRKFWEAQWMAYILLTFEPLANRTTTW